MSTELDSFRERVELARERLRAIPATGPGVLGSPDPETGERWNAGNVLGHLAEILPFWTAQARLVLAGATEAGRGTAGAESRRTGIDSGRELSEEDLRARIEAGIAGLLSLLHEIGPGDLERTFLHRAKSGDRQVTLAAFMEDLLVGHLEGHAKQMAELAST